MNSPLFLFVLMLCIASLVTSIGVTIPSKPVDVGTNWTNVSANYMLTDGTNAESVVNLNNLNVNDDFVLGTSPNSISGSRKFRIKDDGIPFNAIISLHGTGDTGYPAIEFTTDGSYAKRSVIRHDNFSGTNDYGLNFFTTDNGAVSSKMTLNGNGDLELLKGDIIAENVTTKYFKDDTDTTAIKIASSDYRLMNGDNFWAFRWDTGYALANYDWVVGVFKSYLYHSGTGTKLENYNYGDDLQFNGWNDIQLNAPVTASSGIDVTGNINGSNHLDITNDVYVGNDVEVTNDLTVDGTTTFGSTPTGITRKLNVRDDGIQYDARVSLQGTGNTAYPAIEFITDGNANKRTLIRHQYFNNNDYGLNFYTTDNNVVTSAMTLDGDGDLELLNGNLIADNDAQIKGNLGVSTTSPQTLFDINGHITSATLPNDVARISDDVNGISGVEMRNINSGTSADFRFLVSNNDKTAYMAFNMPSNSNTATMFGKTRSTIASLFTAGSSPRDLAIGTYTSNDIIFGTNNNERMKIDNNGNVTINSLSGSYTGGSAYVCVYNDGTLFASEGACP